MTLTDLGWDEEWARAFAAVGTPDLRPGRVGIEFNFIHRIFMEEGELEATVAGRLKHRAARRSELPAVGDWVAVRPRPGERHGDSLAFKRMQPGS